MSKFFTPFILTFVPNILFAQLQHEVPANDSVKPGWSFSLWADYFIIPEESNFLNPTFYADHKAFHFEGRYNYEDMNTASAFAGWKLETGNKFQFIATPMLGFTFGNTNGFLPALELELIYKNFDFYSESEYMIDFESNENNFAYTYTELAATIFKDHVRTGLTGQRTRLYQTEFDVQRGVFAEYYFGRFRAGVYYYDPFSNSNFGVVSLSVDF
jgi:hypothetical protein